MCFQYSVLYSRFDSGVEVIISAMADVSVSAEICLSCAGLTYHSFPFNLVIATKDFGVGVLVLVVGLDKVFA